MERAEVGSLVSDLLIVLGVDAISRIFPLADDQDIAFIDSCHLTPCLSNFQWRCPNSLVRLLMRLVLPFHEGVVSGPEIPHIHAPRMCHFRRTHAFSIFRRIQ